MINYFLEVSICWGLLYLLYLGLFRDTTFFNANRWYLLLSLALGLMLPSFILPDLNRPEVTALQEVYLAPITISVDRIEQEMITITPDHGLDYLSIILNIIYWFGFCIALLVFMKGLWKIYEIFKSSKLEKHPNYVLVKTKCLHLPFSFFGYLFWSEDQPFEPADYDKILTHELAHIRGKHSYDVMFLELLCICFWWNPLIYLYRSAIRNVHEYLADDAVLKHTHRKQYGHLLLRQFQSGLTFALANNFIHSQLKKRIKMMTKTKSRQFLRLKYLFVLPLIVVLALLVSRKTSIAHTIEAETITQLLQNDPFDEDALRAKLTAILKKYDQNEALNSNNKQVLQSYFQTVLSFLSDYPEEQEKILAIQAEITNNEIDLDKIKARNLATIKRFANGEFDSSNSLSTSKGTVFNAVDEMPRFPGCENFAEAERAACSKRQLVEFLVNNMKYPQAAKEAKVEGQVLVKFVVMADGTISNIQAVNDIGFGCADAAKSIVAKMPNWIPGKQEGVPVNTEMTLPFSFKLPKDKQPDEVFKVVQEMPRFPGCEDETDAKKRQDCSNMALLEFIYTNIRYPKESRDLGHEGITVVTFVINQEGRIESPKILRTVDNFMDEEVLYVVELMNEMPDKWIPGRQRGKKVKVQFNLPIKFKLEGGIPERTEERKEPELDLKEFMLHPNPTNGIFNLSFKKEEGQPLSLSIVDNVGKQVLSRNIKAEGSFFQEEFDLSAFAKGRYNISITDGEKTISKGIVLQ